MCVNRMTLFVLLLQVLLASCSGAPPTGPQPTESGSMSFTFTGALEGSFTVDGAHPGLSDQPTTSAGALPSVGGDRLMLSGIRLHGSVLDALNLEVALPSEPGTFAAGSTSTFSYGQSLETGVGQYYVISSGEIVVSEISESRIRGSFAAVAERNVYFPEPMTERIEITDGRFDLPILAGRS
jgi:hypothetical protein